ILTEIGLDLDTMSLTIATPIGFISSFGILAPRALQIDRETPITTHKAEGELTGEQSHPVDIIGRVGQHLTLSCMSHPLQKILLLRSRQKPNLIHQGSHGYFPPRNTLFRSQKSM